MNRKIRILDLFCGAGGSAMGMYCGLIERYPCILIVGIDISPQPHYPSFHDKEYVKHFTFIQGDAMNPPVDLNDFDFIWASPPCQAYQMMNHVNLKRWGFVSKAPRLIEPTRRLLVETGKSYVIENVQGAPLMTQIILCGHSLGLKRIARHRHFESNQLLFAPPCSHRGKGSIIGVYGRLNNRTIIKKVDGFPSSVGASSIEEARNVLGIDWMDDGEIQESVPPAYSEYILRQINL